MGDTIRPEGTAKQIRAFDIYLPSLLNTISNYQGPAAQSSFNTHASLAPQQLALEQALLSYFGPQLNEVGSALQRQQAMNQASNELDVLTGPGAGLVGAAKGLNQMMDPEYYKSREAASDKLVQLLQGQDPNKLSGAESAEVERGLNRMDARSGTLGQPSNNAAITHAFGFGDKLNQKRNTLINTINAVPQNLAAMKSGTDVFQVATGRPSYGQNPGLGMFNTKTSGFMNDVNSIAGNLLGEAGQNVRQNNELTANARDSLDRINETGTMLSNYAGGKS